MVLRIDAEARPSLLPAFASLATEAVAIALSVDPAGVVTGHESDIIPPGPIETENSRRAVSPPSTWSTPVTVPLAGAAPMFRTMIVMVRASPAFGMGGAKVMSPGVI